MKLKELKLNILGTEIKIQIGAVEKAQEKNPGALVIQKISEYLTPVQKPKKVRHIDDYL